MPMFGGKHFSNPAVGRMHEKMGGEEEMPEKKMAEGEKAHHSMHADYHDDGTAHTHIHHTDGTHEHTDHATHEEANDHLKSAMGGKSFEEWAKEEENEPEHMNMHEASRAGGGAF